MLKVGKAGFVSSLAPNNSSIVGSRSRMREKRLMFLPHIFLP